MKNEYQGVRFGAYCRKSSEQEEKQALSIGAQTDWVAQISKELGIALDSNNILSESKSAKKSYTRPVFNKLIGDIEKGKIQALIALHPDRLSRNAGDAGRLIDLLDEGKLKFIVTRGQTFRNTPSDKFFFGMLCSQAKMENDNKGERVKDGLNKKRRMGHPPHTPKIGFLDDPLGDKGFKRWHVDPLRFPLVISLLKLYLTRKYSVSQLWLVARDEMKLTTVQRKREGGKLISRSQFYKLLIDPIYAGYFMHDGVRYELDPSLPRAITEQQHEEILRIRGVKGKPKPKSHPALYNYFMKDAGGGSTCADHKEQLICSNCKHKFSVSNKIACPKCGLSITSMKEPIRLSYTYYQSIRERKNRSVKALCVEEKKIDAFLADFFSKNLAISAELSAWCIKHIGELADKELKEDTERLKSHQERKNALEQKLSRLLDVRLSRAEITRADAEMFDQKERQLKEELASLELSEEVRSSDWLPEVREQFNLAVEVVEIFRNGSLEAKKEALSILGSNLTLDAGNVTVINAKTVEALMEGLLAVRSANPEFEPKNIVDTSSSNPVFASQFCRLLEWRDAFRAFDWRKEFSNAEFHLRTLEQLLSLAR